MYIAVLDKPHQVISFFSELHAMAGEKVTHRWIHNGSIKYRASFDVMAKRWRAWSTQLLPADLAGVWTVEVVDEDGNILDTRTLIYRPKDVDQVVQS